MLPDGSWEAKMALLRFLGISILCVVCIAGTTISFFSEYYIVGTIFYLMGGFMWNLFQRMRPSWLWAYQDKILYIYLLWPIYLLYFYYWLWKRFHDPGRFWIMSKRFPDEEPKFGSLELAILFAKKIAINYNELVIIHDHAIWESDIIGGWGPLGYFVEPSGEVSILTESGKKRIYPLV